MQVLGIVGAVASGKTLVSSILEEFGAVVLSGDEIAHQVLREPEIVRAIRERWGDSLLDDAGDVDRGRLATIVFGETEAARKELEFLEKLVHPRVAQRLRKALDQLQAEAAKIVVIDAALLMETDWQRHCERLIFVDAPPEIRQKYAAARSWDAGELTRREARQLPLESKRSRADYVIHNTGNLDQLCQEISRLWDSLSSRKMAD